MQAWQIVMMVLSKALLHVEVKSSLPTGPAFAGGALVVSGVPSSSLVTILQCLLPQFPLLPVLLRQLRLLTWLWVLTLDRKDPNDACLSPSLDNYRRLGQPECEMPLPVVILLGIVWRSPLITVEAAISGSRGLSINPVVVSTREKWRIVIRPGILW
jgi:hypothetical protein